MGLKTTLPVFREVSTTDGTWTTVAEYAVQNNCSFELEIFLLGKTTNGTLGETAYCKALHRGKRTTSGGLSLIGQPVYLVTFTTGSDTAVNGCVMLVALNPGIGAIPPSIQLQVRGVASRSIDWYGGFKIVMH